MWTGYDLGWLCLGRFSYGVTLKELEASSTLNLYRRDKALNLNDPVFGLPAPIVLYNSCSFNNFKNNEKPMRKSVNRPPTPDAVEGRQEKELTLQEIINVKLTETGEKERLMELLRERLIDCGWKDEMRALCRAFIKKKGRNNVTVDDLVHVITPNGRASIPDSIKAELLQRIRTFLVQAVV